MTRQRTPLLYTRVGILVCSILSSAFVMANPAIAASAHGVHAPAPITPKNLPAAIEPMAAYVPQTACEPVVRSGTRKLATLLAHTYRAYGATSWMSAYACGTDGDPSEHYDGRAIDWMVNVHDKRQHAAARAFLTWALATDSAGNRFAMARRLGIMYLIYDNRIWGAWDGRWTDYNGCQQRPSHADDNSCHRTHMHISLGWNGARGRTSFWTGHTRATDYGPCRARDLNWAPRYGGPNTAGPCRTYPTVHAGHGASATEQALVDYSGAFARRGYHGPAVSAVQQALGVSASGTYGPATVARVRSFQRDHHLASTGRLSQRTWRALLAATH